MHRRNITVNMRNVNFIGLLTILVFALAPSFYWPQAEIPYEVPKVWLYMRVIEFLFLVSLLGFYFKKIRQTNDIDPKTFLFLIVFLVVTLIASLLGSDLGKSIYGNYYRVDGLITLYHLAAFSFLLALFWQRKWQNLLAIGLFLGGVSAAMLNTFGQPNFLAGFLLVTLPFGIYCLTKKLFGKLTRLVVGLGVIAMVIATVKTGSWLGITCILLLVPLWILITSRKNIFLIGALVTTFLVISLSLWAINFNRLNSNPTSYIAEGRERVYRNTFLGAIKRPLLGYGWANADYAFEAVVWPIKFDSDVYVDKAHMYILEIFATTGVVGLAFYLLLTYRVLTLLWVKKSLFTNVLLTSLVLYFLHSQTNVTSISQELVFWLGLGYAMRKPV